jgi:DNA-directed RNA polymerase specialized sigma24 family protein
MTQNTYPPELPKWKIKLIQRRALRMGFRRDEVDDALQRIVPHVLRFVFDPAKANGACEQTALVALIDQQLKAMARAQSRYRRHIEQFRHDLGAQHDREAVPAAALCDEPTELVLDVQMAVAGLPSPERDVCTALGNGCSLAQIARDLGCTWHEVRRTIESIRNRFEVTGLAGWMGR